MIYVTIYQENLSGDLEGFLTFSTSIKVENFCTVSVVDEMKSQDWEVEKGQIFLAFASVHSQELALLIEGDKYFG